VDERLPLLFDQMLTTMQERFDRLSIQISQQSEEIKRIPAAVGQTKSAQAGLEARGFGSVNAKLFEC
jgi:hypothetical protein